METSLKCSFRRQYGALVAGMEVMESYLAEGRAKQTGDQRNMSYSRAITSRDGRLTSQVMSADRMDLKSKEDGDGMCQGLKAAESGGKTSAGEEKKEEGNDKKDLVEGDENDGQGVEDNRELEEVARLPRPHTSGSSIPEFIRTRHPMTSKDHSPTHTKVRVDTANPRLLVGHHDNMLVMSSTHVIKYPRMIPRPSQYSNLGMVKRTLPTIVQEGDLSPEAEAGLLEKQRSLISLVDRSRRCSSVDVTGSRDAGSHIRDSPRGQRRQGASVVLIRAPSSSRPLARSRSNMAAPSLMIDTSSSPPASSRSARGQVLLRSPWRYKNDRVKSTKSATALGPSRKGGDDCETSEGVAKRDTSSEDSAALQAVSLSNLPPDENMFVKKRGSTDALTSYLRIIPPGFQMVPGALDGATPKSRLENYVKLGADKRIYLTFCQSVGPELSMRRALPMRKPRNNFLEEPKEEGKKTKRVVRIQPIKIP